MMRASIVSAPTAVARDAQQPVAVDGAADDAVARPLLHRQALAGQQRFVDARLAPSIDHAIDRDALARPHHDEVADAPRSTGTSRLGAVGAARRAVLGAQRQQRADGGAGRPPGARLQPLPSRTSVMTTAARLEIEVRRHADAIAQRQRPR